VCAAGGDRTVAFTDMLRYGVTEEGATVTTRLYCFKPIGHYMYHPVLHYITLGSAPTVYLCVLCGSENKQRLFPYTALTDWFV
jgi:hypothetical protein